MPVEEMEMKFTIKEVKTATAIVEYEDGSWAEVDYAGKTEDEFLALVWDFSPKPAAEAPLFTLTVGQEGNVEAPSVEADQDVVEEEEGPQTPEDLRKAAYGTPETQLEYITERGIEAWQEHVAAINATFPLEV